MIFKLKSLKSNQEFMKYFRNISWLFFEKLFKLAIGFFVIIYLTRYLGPEKFGLLSYSQSFVGIFIAFSTLGLDSIVIRELVKSQNNRDKLLGTAFYLKLITSIMAMLLVLILNNIINKEDTSSILINVIMFTTIFNSLNIINIYFQAKVLSKYVVYSSSISFIISSLVKIVLIYIEAELIYFAYALLADSIILSIAFVNIYGLQKLSLLDWKFDKKIALGFLKSAWPLILVALSVFIYTKIDQVMIKNMISDEAVGNYAVAIKVSELFYFIPTIIITSLFPKIVESKQNSEETYLILLERLYRIVIWIAIPIAGIIALFSNEIVDILYGEQYTQAGRILAVLVFSIIFFSINIVFTKILYVEHWEKKYLYKSIFGVIINILLNYFLLKAYGVIGAAVATVITLFILSYVYDLIDKDLRRLYYLKFKCFSPFSFDKFSKGKL